MPVLLPKTALTVPVATGNGASKTFDGGWCSVFCYGTFDSGTVTLQASPDSGTTWFTVKDSIGDNVTFAANGYFSMVVLGGNPLVRAALTGSSGATALTLELHFGAALMF